MQKRTALPTRKCNRLEPKRQHLGLHASRNCTTLAWQTAGVAAKPRDLFPSKWRARRHPRKTGHVIHHARQSPTRKSGGICRKSADNRPTFASPGPCCVRQHPRIADDALDDANCEQNTAQFGQIVARRHPHPLGGRRAHPPPRRRL
eukprot:3754170-Prymnesium_polylepis.1